MNKVISSGNITTFLQTDKNIQSILLFLYFTAVSLSMILSGYTFLDEMDDMYLRSFLIAGETRTSIMSIPLSNLISTLYGYMPLLQWYSLTIFIYMSIISLLFAFYITNLKDKHLKILAVLLSTLILIHAWLGISITFVTLLLVALSIPLIRNHQVTFWILILLASLLRGGIIFSILPLLMIPYILLFKKESLTQKKIIAIFILMSTILFNNYLPSLDHEYKEWLSYNKARTYFNDYNGIDKKNILSDNEKLISNTWWLQDEILLPTEKVIQAAGTKLDAIIISFTNFNIGKIISIFYNNKLLILLFLIAAYIIYKEQKNTSRLLYVFFAISFFILLVVRDMNRVSYPLTILWGTLLFLKLLKDQKITLLKGSIIIAVFLLILDLPRLRVYHYQENEKLKNEFIHLMNLYPIKYEPAVGFPRSWGIIGRVFKQSHLFRESQWAPFNEDGLLIAGWTVRHPHFYKSHDISFKGEARKYKSFYDFIIDENVGFIGSKESDSTLNNTILKMYDKKYAHQVNCYHAIKVLGESEHFSITQIIKKCEK